jgi:hypothetical protein
MKNNSKLMAWALAIGLLSSALVCQQAQAAGIDGAITIKGGAVFDTGDINTANSVTDFQNTVVESRDGDFVPFVAVGAAVTMAEPWVFDPSTVTAGLWSVGGFTFDLDASTIIFQGFGFLSVEGTGTVSGNGFDPTDGIWRFTSQAPSAAGVFSFSASTAVPEGGLTVGLLGLALVAVEGLRRKIKK